jgi:hypothetical protein
VPTADRSRDEPLIFPIGHYTGVLYRSVDPPAYHHTVMLGARVVQLSDPQFSVWLLARGPQASARGVAWTRSHVLVEATAAGVADPARVLAGLVAEGLLVETIPDTEHSVEFAESYRLVPLMLGLGNTAEEPWQQGIGFFGRPALTVRSVHYSLWEWSHVDGDLWTGCHAHADTAIRAGITDPEQTVPERVLTDFLGALHPLLASGAACLDLARVREGAA